jgi:hypothetical protein
VGFDSIQVFHCLMLRSVVLWLSEVEASLILDL